MLTTTEKPGHRADCNVEHQAGTSCRQLLGTIFLPTASAAALFEHELTGQFSDGLWENARPYGHWRFWSNLAVAIDPRLATVYVHVEYWRIPDKDRPRKNRYNLAALHEYVLDRMLKIGRMARACELTGDKFPGRIATEYMPDTLADFKVRRGADTNLDSVSEETAVAYYATTYTLKDLKADERYIKQAMATVQL